MGAGGCFRFVQFYRCGWFYGRSLAYGYSLSYRCGCRRRGGSRSRSPIRSLARPRAAFEVTDAAGIFATGFERAEVFEHGVELALERAEVAAEKLERVGATSRGFPGSGEMSDGIEDGEGLGGFVGKDSGVGVETVQQ